MVESPPVTFHSDQSAESLTVSGTKPGSTQHSVNSPWGFSPRLSRCCSRLWPQTLRCTSLDPVCAPTGSCPDCWGVNRGHALDRDTNNKQLSQWLSDSQIISPSRWLTALTRICCFSLSDTDPKSWIKDVTVDSETNSVLYVCLVYLVKNGYSRQTNVTSEESVDANMRVPPVWHVCVVVPVLSVLLCVDVGVHPSLAAGRRGSRHRELRGPVTKTLGSLWILLGRVLEGSAATLHNTWL